MTKREITREWAAELLWDEIKRLRMLSIQTDDREKAWEYNRLADAICLARAALEKEIPPQREQMTVVIKGIPPSLNEFAGRKNTWEYRRAKQQWTYAVKLACQAHKDRPPKPYPKALVEITYFFPDRRRHDADNYAGKFLLDGLTKAGVILDDDLRHITTTIRGEWDKEEPRTRIVVTGYEEKTL